MSDVLDAIARYQMTDAEADAYKMACVYEHLLQKWFPDLRLCIKKTSGDPRAKEVFKYCWKVLAEHGHELPRADYKYYVLAQLKIFKKISEEGKTPLISANCLAGTKAWRRWKLYEDRFVRQSAFRSVQDAGIVVNPAEKVVAELKTTRAYLLLKLRELTTQGILDALEGRAMLRWVVMKNVSGYYPHLSPIVQGWLAGRGLTVSGYFGHSLDIYADGVNDAARQHFVNEFAYEFGVSV